MSIAEDYGLPETADGAINQWADENKPFHWFVAFHSTMARGGFDVVVGNPPYVGYAAKNVPLMMPSLSTGTCGNLYAPVFERSLDLLSPEGHLGLVVPLSITFSGDMSALRGRIAASCSWAHLSSFDNIPDRLFTGVKESTNTSSANQQRVTIVLVEKGEGPCTLNTSPILRWRASERPELFTCLPVATASGPLRDAPVAKLGSEWEVELLDAWMSSGQPLSTLIRKGGSHKLVVPKTAGYYIAAYPSALERNKQHVLSFGAVADRDLAMLLLNSNVFFWFWRAFGDGFDVTGGVVGSCPTPASGLDDEGRELVTELHAALDECTVYKRYRGVDVPNVNFNLRLDILDRIDEWIVRPLGVEVPERGFLWSKSNSFFALQVPKSSLDSRVS